MLPYRGRTRYQTPHTTQWYHIPHVVLDTFLSENSGSWRAKGPSSAAMFNTSHPEAVLRSYMYKQICICINRVSKPQSWLSSLLPHFSCSHLAPVHLFRMSGLGPSYLLVLIARMLSLSTVLWLYFITFFCLKCYLIGDSFEIISHGLPPWLDR